MGMRYIGTQQYFIEGSELEKKKVTLRDYFPGYVLEPVMMRVPTGGYWWRVFFQWQLRLAISLFLRPRSGAVGDLDQSEVDGVYDREAVTYDWKHHWTTRWMDTGWRRFAAQVIAAQVSNRAGPKMLLDLCTGTGLTITEMLTELGQWPVGGIIVGVDYNKKMLMQAEQRDYGSDLWDVRLVRSDATCLTNCKLPSNEWTCFDSETFHGVAQVFGIGGISDPISVFRQVLVTLKRGGVYVLVDMHMPIPGQPGRMPLFGKTPLLEAMTYQRTTIPLALKRLWGWRDTTLDFYLLPLVAWQENEHRWWGWEVLSRFVESERWWLGLPVMPVAKMVVRKVPLSADEGRRRNELLMDALSLVVKEN